MIIHRVTFFDSRLYILAGNVVFLFSIQEETSVSKPSKKKSVVGSKEIIADYTEDYVGFSLEFFLALIGFPFSKYSIEPFARSTERWLGADARLHKKIKNFRPFYMQFKRPHAYPDDSTSKIITDRKKLSLEYSPRSIFFKLQPKMKNQNNLQHNVLFKLNSRLRSKKLGSAAYVCPLFLDRASYRSHLHWSGLIQWFNYGKMYPWSFKNINLTTSSSKFMLRDVPFFSEHISIFPHDKVTSANHRYSFTERGRDLCFHSPLLVQDSIKSLHAFLIEELNNFEIEENRITLQTSIEELNKLRDSFESDGMDIVIDRIMDDPVGSWMDWGQYMKDYYDIDQYAFIEWDE